MQALGRHIIAELFDCVLEKINDVSYVEKSMLDAADKAGATVINSTFHHFSPYGVSGVIVIQESHISIHCWPEYGYVSLDIYTCGDTVNPWVAYEFLKDSFGASHGSTMELNRGQSHLLKPKALAKTKANEVVGDAKVKHNRNVWFTEKSEDIALSLRHTGDRLFLHQSDYQKIEIYNTEAFGKILVLDGNIVCAEEDENVYHEMISHVPVFSHPKPKNILVIGGGDGGTIRELVRHQNIESIDLVEIDECVIDAAKKYLPQLADSLNDERVNIRIEDGIDFVKKSSEGLYDIVIVDSDDPAGPGKGLFTDAFYRDVYSVLTPDGILVTQSESPRFNQHIFKEVYQIYNQIFGKDHVHCYLMFLPSFPSGMWSFSFCSKGQVFPVENLDSKLVNGFCIDQALKYYDPEIHKASFVLPKFVKDMLS